jgi:23S rRNA (adenine-N6)-dimethyltransferase
VLIVQWELAAKQTAVWPATERSTYWRAWFDVSIARRLERSAFSPVPSVDAAVLHVTRLARPLVRVEDAGAYRRFISDAFRAGNAPGRLGRPHLSRLEVKRLAPTLGFAPGARPRDLDYRQWAALFAVRRAG